MPPGTPLPSPSRATTGPHSPLAAGKTPVSPRPLPLCQLQPPAPRPCLPLPPCLARAVPSSQRSWAGASACCQQDFLTLSPAPLPLSWARPRDSFPPPQCLGLGTRQHLGNWRSRVSLGAGTGAGQRPRLLGSFRATHPGLLLPHLREGETESRARGSGRPSSRSHAGDEPRRLGPDPIPSRSRGRTQVSGLLGRQLRPALGGRGSGFQGPGWSGVSAARGPGNGTAQTRSCQTEVLVCARVRGRGHEPCTAGLARPGQPWAQVRVTPGPGPLCRGLPAWVQWAALEEVGLGAQTPGFCLPIHPFGGDLGRGGLGAPLP